MSPKTPPVTFADSRWLFLRLLGVVYFIAFVSLAVQITGLVGEHGILPIGDLFEQVHDLYGARAYYFLPTLVWLSPSDAFLASLCWTGAGVSVLLIAGEVPAASAAILWLIYLSLTVAGQVFLQFQWDALLLETGLLAIFYAPLSWRSRLGVDDEPPAIVRWTIWLLAFKLTFLSGITKLLSRDATWAAWTALNYHYETQPLPAWTSWFMYQLPPSVHYWSTAGMLLIELGASWLIFLPPRFRRARLTSCLLMSALQLAIGATGNYGFFNLLTVVLYLSLLDDRTLRRLLPQYSAPAEDRSEHRGQVAWRTSANVVALGIAVLSAMTLFREMDRTRGRQGLFDRSWPAAVLAWIAPLDSVNGYGLFRVMTTERPEIVVEVSEDGSIWKEREFRWKPGSVTGRPRFVEPHMPRLDWQMWFAALGPRSAEVWLLRLVGRMLDDEATVTRLLGPDPLQGRLRYVRLAYYEYHFTSRSEHANTGAWWKREFVGYLTDPIEAKALSRGRSGG
jgi:lipase maturation factor